MNAMERSRQFEPDLRTVRTGRHYVRDILLEWDLEQLVDDAQLCVSEIVTNAVRHAGTEVTISVRLDDTDGTILVEVHDGMPELTSRPSSEPVPNTSPGGRGLHIVAAVSKAWGIRAADTGKVIWFRLPVPRAGRRDEDADVLSITRNQASTVEAAPESEPMPGYGQARSTG